jgi:CheY-like chemotaxis protein
MANVKLVLIVEDDESFARLYTEELTKKDPNVKVICAKNGTEAIEACKSYHIDLGIIDINLTYGSENDLSGLVLGKLLSHNGYKFPLLFITALHREPGRLDAIQQRTREIRKYHHSVVATLPKASGYSRIIETANILLQDVTAMARFRRLITQIGHAIYTMLIGVHQ